MATHGRILAWRTPRAGEPGGLRSGGSQRFYDDARRVRACAPAGRLLLKVPHAPPPRINDTDVHIRGEELLCTHVAWRVRVLKAEPLPLITTASPSASVRAPHVCARPSSRSTA